MIHTKHRTVFLAPGSFSPVVEHIDCVHWNVNEALTHYNSLADGSNKPYAFQFETYITADPIPDGLGGFLTVQSKVVAKSGLYHINGKVLTLADVKAMKDQDIVARNMEYNDMKLIVETNNGWRQFAKFFKGDYLIDSATGVVTLPKGVS